MSVNEEDDEVEVAVMHSAGRNRFYWPCPLEDCLTYPHEDYKGIIEEPQKVTRHYQLTADSWRLFEGLLEFCALNQTP